MKHIALLLAGLLVLSACTIAPPTQTYEPNKPVFEVQTPEELVRPSNLARFVSLEQFEETLATSSLNGGVMARNFGSDVVMMESAMDGAATSAPTLKAVNEYSETNVQVQGVDEQDLIKTDGNYIYTFSGTTLFIANAWPAEDLDVISSTLLEDISPTGLFVHEDTLVVIGYGQEDYNSRLGYILPRYGNTAAHIFDISDRKNPKQTDTIVLDGNFNTARMKDSHMYIMTTRYQHDGVPELPIILRNGEASEIAVDSIWYYPFPYNSPQLSMAYSVNLEDTEDIQSAGVVTESGAQVYMSHSNIYFASTQWVDTYALLMQATVAVVKPSLTQRQINLLDRIDAVDSDILSDSEKLSRMMQVVNQYTSTLTSDERKLLEDETEKAYRALLDEYEYYTYTIISRVAYDDGKMSVEANGKVPGRVHSQFAMDEWYDPRIQDDIPPVLRVATTVDRFNSWTVDIEEESHSVVTTLNDNLEVMDQVAGIAKGERIFSTRYVDDTLYMVTFRQVDPFFVIDLSRPEAIEIVGELKIPGFSRYLHPVSEDVILGLGRDATLEGRQEGLKISLFNVANPEDPEEIATWIADGRYTGSSAEWDHHAFLFSADKELLVIPVNKYDYENNDHFNGVFVFHVTEDSVELTGTIQHGTNSRYDYQSAIERSLYIEDVLYTKSYGKILASEISTLDEIEIAVLKVLDSNRKYPVFYEEGDIAIAEPAIAIEAVE